MRVYFAPIVPDTVATVREYLLKYSEEFGLKDRVPGSSAFCEVLSIDLPENAAAWQFIKKMKELCEVRIN